MRKRISKREAYERVKRSSREQAEALARDLAREADLQSLIYTPELVLDLIEHARKRGIEKGRAMERTARDGAATMSWTATGIDPAKLRYVPKDAA